MLQLRSIGRCASGVLLALVGLGLGRAPAQSATPQAAPTAEEWSRRLASAAAESPEAAAARTALRALASFAPGDPETREAVFALALHATSRPPDQVSREEIDAMSAAVMLYGDDRRTIGVLRALANAQLARDDVFGAHIAFTALMSETQVDEESPALRAAAAANAARVRDMASALAWAQTLDPAQLDPAALKQFHYACLVAGQAIGHYELALGSLREANAEELRTDPAALLASARTHEALGLLENAVTDFALFGNLHPKAPEHAEVLRNLARLEARIGRRKHAERTLQWLIELHPSSTEAVQARLDLLELDGEDAAIGGIAGYLTALREATDSTGARAVCDRMTRRLLAAGFALEAIATLAAEARRDDPGLAPLAAKQCLIDHLDSAVSLLDARKDRVGVAAAAAVAESLALSIPPASAGQVRNARLALGLPAAGGGPQALALAEAHAALRRGEFDTARLRSASLLLRRDLDPVVAVELRAVLAESLWRTEQPAEALATLDEGIAATPGAAARPLLVLRADLFFGTDRERACQDYRSAAEIKPSPWVTRQVERCAQVTTAGKRA